MKNRLTSFGFWIGTSFLWWFPEGIIRGLFTVMADVVWLMNTRGVRQLKLNLSRVIDVLPESKKVRHLSRLGLRSYMRYYCETFLLSRWTPEKIKSSVRAENDNEVRKALSTGGIILTLPHSGNWDLAGAWTTLSLRQISTVAERLKPESVFKKFLKLRTDLGIDVVPLKGTTGVYEFLRERLNQGNIVPLLGDRDVAKSGMNNDFFGAKASLPVGAALLALDTGRPIFTCSTWYDGAQLVITFDDPIYVSATDIPPRERLRIAQQVSAQIADRFANHISEHPEDWHMLQPVWKDLIA